MATETGPTEATAFISARSLPLRMSTNPVSLAELLEGSYWHGWSSFRNKSKFNSKPKLVTKLHVIKADLPTQDTYSSQVRIRILRVQTAVILDVLESLVHQTTVAALVALWSGAIYQVLLTQRHQLPGLSEVLTLQGSGGAKGPAGATVTLEAKEQREICSD